MARSTSTSVQRRSFQHRLRLPRRAVLAAIVLLAAASSHAPVAAQEIPFRHTVIDADGPSDPHCKTVGDINGDGYLDALVASSSGGGMYWYAYPDWRKHAIRASGSWTTDMQVGDIDGDGDLDVVIPNGSGLHWYENPLSGGGDPAVDAWREHRIGSEGQDNHDVELGDLNGDGRLDVLTRRKRGGGTFVWLQESPLDWTQVTASSRNGEGSALGDLDGDGDLDIAADGSWLENQAGGTTWLEHRFDPGAPGDVGVHIADLDGDGRNEIVLAPSESSSGVLAWYRSDTPRSGAWTKRIVDGSVSFLHTFKTADMDGDGDLDLVTAEMHQSSDPDEVGIYFNDLAGGREENWAQQVVATSGSHNLRVGDFGNDGDVDIFGANWSDDAPNGAVIDLWENQSGPPEPLPLDDWTRHLIDGALPWRAVFVGASDLDGDRRTDIVAGGWWYRNPGDAAGSWTRRAVGAPLNNMALLRDLDGDGDDDVLGTDGRPDGAAFSWARNDGSGGFEILSNIEPADGDFLQGIAGASFAAGEPERIALSWHAGGRGVQMLTVPTDPATETWAWARISSDSQDEALSAGDLDGDGDLDLFQGTQWLRNDGASWSAHAASTVFADPDRSRLADLDGDGDLDAVVGPEGDSVDLVWLRNPGVAGEDWPAQIIGRGLGGVYSMHLADMDLDGDPDVVLGEHKGATRVLIFENGGSGASWTAHEVDPGGSGIDHHDGTVPVDIDGDGDLDIVSIGWFNQKVWLFENGARDGGPLIRPTAAPATAVPPTPVGPTAVPGTPAPLPPASALVAHWTMDDGDGATAQDTSGNAHHGTLQGDPLWEPQGRRDGALRFDGVDDHVTAGAFSVTGEALTLMAWVRAEALDHVGSYRDARILTKAVGTAEQDHEWMLSTISEGSATRLRFRIKTEGDTQTLIAGTGDLATERWLHAAAVYDGSRMRLFLDGAEVGSTETQGALAANDDAPVWIGGSPPAGDTRPWRGWIDDVRVYRVALSPAQIATLAAGAPPPTAEPSTPPTGRLVIPYLLRSAGAGP